MSGELRPRVQFSEKLGQILRRQGKQRLYQTEADFPAAAFLAQTRIGERNNMRHFGGKNQRQHIQRHLAWILQTKKAPATALTRRQNLILQRR